MIVDYEDFLIGSTGTKTSLLVPVDSLLNSFPHQNALRPTKGYRAKFDDERQL